VPFTSITLRTGRREHELAPDAAASPETPTREHAPAP